MLPRILIIDDQLGSGSGRQEFCNLAELKDVTPEMQAEPPEEPVAEVYFLRGQKIVDGKVKNDLPGTLEHIRQGCLNAPPWAMVFIDMEFKTGKVNQNGKPAGRPDDSDPSRYFGLTILKGMVKDPLLRQLPVVIMSAMAADPVESIYPKYRAIEFFDKDEITLHGNGRYKIAKLLEEHGLIEDKKGVIIGSSLAMLTCLRDARKRAKMGDDNIILVGEPGVGKELMAEYIHYNSPKKDGPFKTYFCNAPDTIVDRDLFGYERNAFTGADRRQNGAIDLAAGGTLFIDEFGHLSALVQDRLPRLLEKNTRQTQRLGEIDARRVDLQVVLATNKFELLESGSADFRADILQRVQASSNPIILPPLRERKKDILVLARHLLIKIESDCLGKYEAFQGRTIDASAEQALLKHSWPGNVRELKDRLEFAVTNFPKHTVLTAETLNITTDGANKRQQQKESTPSDDAQRHVSSRPPSKLEELFDHLDKMLSEFPIDPYRDNLYGSKPRIEEISRKFIQRLAGAVLCKYLHCSSDDESLLEKCTAGRKNTEAMKHLLGKTTKGKAPQRLLRQIAGLSQKGESVQYPSVIPFVDRDEQVREKFRTSIVRSINQKKNSRNRKEKEVLPFTLSDITSSIRSISSKDEYTQLPQEYCKSMMLIFENYNAKHASADDLDVKDVKKIKNLVGAILTLCPDEIVTLIQQLDDKVRKNLLLDHSTSDGLISNLVAQRHPQSDQEGNVDDDKAPPPEHLVELITLSEKGWESPSTD